MPQQQQGPPDEPVGAAWKRRDKVQPADFGKAKGLTPAGAAGGGNARAAAARSPSGRLLRPTISSKIKVKGAEGYVAEDKKPSALAQSPSAKQKQQGSRPTAAAAQPKATSSAPTSTGKPVPTASAAGAGADAGTAQTSYVKLESPVIGTGSDSTASTMTAGRSSLGHTGSYRQDSSTISGLQMTMNAAFDTLGSSQGSLQAARMRLGLAAGVQAAEVGCAGSQALAVLHGLPVLPVWPGAHACAKCHARFGTLWLPQ